MPFCIYADTEAYLIPQNQFSNVKRQSDETENENDLCLENLEKFFNYTSEDKDMDMTWSGDDDDSDTEEGDKEKNISTLSLDDNLHPWSSKRLKITSTQDIEETLDTLQRKSGVINKHKMASYAVTVTCPSHLKSHFEPVYLYRGEGAEEKFVQLLAKLQEKIEFLFEKEGNQQMRALSTVQQEIYHAATNCHICKQEITYEKDFQSWQNQLKELKTKNPSLGQSDDGTLIFQPKFRSYFKSDNDRLGPAVMDHDHWTGDFRGRYFL